MSDSNKGGDKQFFAPRVPKFSIDGGDTNGDGGGGTHYTPWLVIRAQAGDDGTRPLPAGEVFWESPDVWTTGPGGMNQPLPGQQNTVNARVSNLGLMDAIGVFVNFYWADPSIAIDMANVHLIGTGTVDVLAQSTATLACPTPWVPVVVNDGHECLIAEAFLPVSDPLTAPLDPVDDRHVGQKNEQLVGVGPGMMMKVRLRAANNAPLAQALTISVHGRPLREVPASLAGQTVAGIKAFLPGGRMLPVTLHPAPESRMFSPPSVEFARRLLAETQRAVAGTAQVVLAPAQLSHREVFEPWESRTIEVSAQLPADAKPGELFAFQVVQSCGAMVSGGYTAYVVATGL